MKAADRALQAIEQHGYIERDVHAWETWVTPGKPKQSVCGTITVKKLLAEGKIRVIRKKGDEAVEIGPKA